MSWLRLLSECFVPLRTRSSKSLPQTQLVDILSHKPHREFPRYLPSLCYAHSKASTSGCRILRCYGFRETTRSIGTYSVVRWRPESLQKSWSQTRKHILRLQVSFTGRTVTEIRWALHCSHFPCIGADASIHVAGAWSVILLPGWLTGLHDIETA